MLIASSDRSKGFIGKMAGSIVAVRALIEILEQLGVPRDEFFRVSRLDPKRLDPAEARIELEELDAAHAVALDLTGDAALGLKMGELVSATMFNLAAHLVAHATTLREGIQALFQFHRLVADRQMWHLELEGPLATLRCEIEPGPPRCRRFRAEFTMTGFHRMLRLFAPASRPCAVNFDYPMPAYSAEYRRVFGGAERFEQPTTGIVFDRALLEAKQLNQDAEFHKALCAQAEKRVSRLTRTTTYAERVREYVLGCSPADRRNMATVARGLGMSARSLRRRLQEEGSSYSDIAESALATLAKRLISDEERTIEATAYEMGYSDPTAFHRAFKRWTGSTPTAFRQNAYANGAE